MRPWIAALLLPVAACAAEGKRVLYVTHTAGFRHGSIEASRTAIGQAASRIGFEVVPTEDLSLISAASLRGFDIVFFFTSGELPLSDSQKRDLLDFVRGGKGFGGAHSATDTLYTWPEYGEMIGGYFDGHPWTQEASVDVEDPDHPATRGLGPSFRILEEFYQFRAFSRDRVRVLATLDTRSVDLKAEGVNRADGDFALAWVRPYGEGRVFYTAFGHFDETWRDPRFQGMLAGALSWLGRLDDASGAPRTGRPAVSAVSTLGSPLSGIVAPGSLIEVTGSGLTLGSSMEAVALPLPFRLAGTRLTLGGVDAPLVAAAPARLLALAPFDVKTGEVVAVTGVEAGPIFNARVEEVAPAILAVAPGAAVSIYATGLGTVTPVGGYQVTTRVPEVTIGGNRAEVIFSGLSPALAGVYQVNVIPPPGAVAGAPVLIESGGRRSNEGKLP
jgi:type 1 glutamine amidotransferase